MKALVGSFNQEKALTLVVAFSVLVKTWWTFVSSSTVYSQCVLAGAAVSWLHLGVGLEQEDAGGGAAPLDEDNQGGDGGYADQGDDARDA